MVPDVLFICFILAKTVRFSDSPSYSAHPEDREAARNFLTEALPRTFTINVDHDQDAATRPEAPHTSTPPKTVPVPPPATKTIPKKTSQKPQQKSESKPATSKGTVCDSMWILRIYY